MVEMKKEKKQAEGSEKVLYLGKTLIYPMKMDSTELGNERLFTAIFATRNGKYGLNFHV